MSRLFPFSHQYISIKIKEKHSNLYIYILSIIVYFGYFREFQFHWGGWGHTQQYSGLTPGSLLRNHSQWCSGCRVISEIPTWVGQIQGMCLNPCTTFSPVLDIFLETHSLKCSYCFKLCEKYFKGLEPVDDCYNSCFSFKIHFKGILCKNGYLLSYLGKYCTHSSSPQVKHQWNNISQVI